MLKGRVRWFDAQKGYGMIWEEATNQNVFVHIADVIDGRPLTTGDEVEFEIQESPYGPRAVKVRKFTVQ